MHFRHALIAAVMLLSVVGCAADESVILYWLDKVSDGNMTSFGVYPGIDAACAASPNRAPVCEPGTCRMVLGTGPVGAPSPTPLPTYYPSPIPVKFYVPTSTPVYVDVGAPASSHTAYTWSQFVASGTSGLALPNTPVAAPNNDYWTGYFSDGTDAAANSLINCNGWTETNSPSPLPSAGARGTPTGYFIAPSVPCTGKKALLCTCQGPVPPTPAPTRAPSKSPTMPTRAPSGSPTVTITNSPTTTQSPRAIPAAATMLTSMWGLTLVAVFFFL